jgi:hypothetical protein
MQRLEPKLSYDTPSVATRTVCLDQAIFKLYTYTDPTYVWIKHDDRIFDGKVPASVIIVLPTLVLVIISRPFAPIKPSLPFVATDVPNPSPSTPLFADILDWRLQIPNEEV